jgi:hypothetical protein
MAVIKRKLKREMKSIENDVFMFVFRADRDKALETTFRPNGSVSGIL